MADIAYDTPIEISATASPTASVIWLHGLGADGNDFVPVVHMLNLPQVRFILPHAAFKKVSANNGYEMRAWYDVFGFTPSSREDEAGIHESQAYIETLIGMKSRAAFQAIESCWQAFRKAAPWLYKQHCATSKH